MSKTIISFFAILLVSFSSGFDVQNFLNQNCEQSYWPFVKLVCEKFELTADDVKSFQENDFVVSENAISVHFRTCNIGVLNEKFFSKFPSAQTMIFKQCSFAMDYTENVEYISKIEVLEIEAGNITNNKNTNSFASLTSLKRLSIGTINFEYPVIENTLLQKNTQLDEISIFASGITDIEQDVFENLKEITKITIIFNKLNTLHPQLLKCNSKLEELYIPNNDLTEIPEFGFFPDSLRELALHNNNLVFVNRNHFKNLSNLKLLYLAINRDINISPDAFHDLKNLNNLDLSFTDNNQLIKIHFQNLKKLTKLDLSHNEIVLIPDYVFSDMEKLKTLDLSYNQISSLNRRMFENLEELRQLDLSSNKISYIGNDVFRDLPGLNVNLNGNPINRY